jgi:hypothetical protein
MRSTRAFAAAATIVLSYPAALAVEQLVGGGSETVIHLVAGAGFLVFAVSVFDFALPRWVNGVGAAAVGAFGLIFLLQGVSDLTEVESVRVIAFDVLGHHVERFLPDVVYLWFLALLVWASSGRSRILGWVIMTLVVASELAALAALVFALTLPNLKIAVLLPFVWLLFESAERAPRPAVVRADTALTHS